MKEIQRIEEDLIIDKGPFSSDFNERLGEMVTLEGKKFAKETAGNMSRVVFIALPLALSGCTNSSNTEPFNWAASAGFVAGGVSAIEEAFESGQKNFFRKSVSIAVKFASGFTAGYAIGHNAEEGGSWISPENWPFTAALVPSIYAIVRETKLSNLGREVGSKVSEVKEKRRQAEHERRVALLARKTKSWNLGKSVGAQRELDRLGIDRKTVEKILERERRFK